ncbi:transcriptional regulator, SARP family protein [Streptomyces albireticuli]|uniref:Transcriptional regulator, SARP family protein n=1 Tax=Streptomyces albireticuli TaxID=1940 RepID=A0A1Z2KYY2_9ACTN|nr:BTAD domain-containing putative transcriptional regulator [Streptomyces albireticuli]ARZ67258.1 transcriptional regulator, SARP family protein [Streptomyces albireticuli]
MIEFRLLGAVELRVEGVRVDVGPARQRAVLATLLVQSPLTASMDSLIDRVWGDSPPAGARGVVYTYIARLRRALTRATEGLPERLLLRREPAGYLMDIDSDCVDLHRFRRLVAQARAAGASTPQRSAWLAEALALWGGEPLAGVNNEWAQNLRGALRTLKYEALTEWADARLEVGGSAEVIGALRQELLEAPMVEPLHEGLTRALYLSGRRSEALIQYERARRVIADELGTDPGPGLQRLYGLMLAGEPLTGTGERAVVRTASESAAPAGTGVPGSSSKAAEAPAPALSRFRLPDLLPAGHADFVGREADVGWIHEALTKGEGHGPAVAIVRGGPGVGKSALALHAAHRFGTHYPDGRVYLDLRGTGDRPLSPLAALFRMLRATGVDPRECTGDIDELMRLYRARLAGRRVLLVLDDAADDSQLMTLLPSGSACGVIVTTRAPFAKRGGALTRNLAGLGRGEGVRLLARLVGESRVEAERVAAGRLVQLCGGVPLALCAVASRMDARPHYTVRWHLDRVADEKRCLDVLSYGSFDMRASLALSYGRLSPTASRAFRALGCESDARSEAVPEDWRGPVGVTRQETEEALEELVDAHLLHVAGRDVTGRIHYRLHYLQRAYARSLSACERQAA